MVAALEGLGAGCPGDQGGAGASGAEMSALRARPPCFRLQFPRLYNGRKAEAEGSAGEKREERGGRAGGRVPTPFSLVWS